MTHGTDCSGFTMSVFKKFGISLPRTSGAQSGVGKKISPSSARAGDLIFYASGGHVNHVALCIGGGRVVHASNPRTRELRQVICIIVNHIVRDEFLVKSKKSYNSKTNACTQTIVVMCAGVIYQQLKQRNCDIC